MFDGKVFNVMIIGYERLRMVADDLADSHDIDIVICDEGHRLKTVKNKSAKAIEALNTSRRVILSGTPIQNDLGEFYAMVNFVNNGCLGSAKAFLKDFENPIMRSRQPNASEEDVQKGEEASTELSHTTSLFILRRKAEILADFLTTKT
ncbi:MAG: helicase, partial [Watsoniomyces obsoletus]